MENLNESFRTGIDKAIASLNGTKKHPETLDSLQDFSQKEGSRPQYEDQVDKAKQLLDAFTSDLFDAYTNVREDIISALDPADQERFRRQTPDNVQDALKRFDD